MLAIQVREEAKATWEEAVAFAREAGVTPAMGVQRAIDEGIWTGSSSSRSSRRSLRRRRTVPLVSWFRDRAGTHRALRKKACPLATPWPHPQRFLIARSGFSRGCREHLSPAKRPIVAQGRSESFLAHPGSIPSATGTRTRASPTRQRRRSSAGGRYKIPPSVAKAWPRDEREGPGS